MANIQVSVAISAEEYYEKNKSIVDELIATAKCLLTAASPIVDLLSSLLIKGTTTSGVIRNKTESILLLGPSRDWAGKPCAPYPTVMGPGGSAYFVHANQHLLLGASDMGAVIYTTSKTALGWLLAWSVGGAHGSGNKVYVEAGPLELLTNWDNVKAKLHASRSECYSVNPCAGTLMFAKITPTSDKAELVALYEKI